MAEFDENTKKYLQLGAIDREYVLKFRQQAAKRKFKQIDILRQIISWWNSLDVEKQKEIYYQTNRDHNMSDNEIGKLWSEMEKIAKKVGVKIKRKRV